MTRIKICGITNLSDALAAVEFGADALGFIFVPGSPRCIRDTASAEAILKMLPPLVSTVAVCVTPADAPASLLARFSAIQCYSSGGVPRPNEAIRRIRAVRVRGLESLDELDGSDLPEDALLLDTYHAERLGGSGAPFDWSIACEAKSRFRKPIILAGGLTPQNVGAAIQAVWPYAVDVSSGVEAEPGRKDHAALERFIWAAREADRCRDSP